MQKVCCADAQLPCLFRVDLIDFDMHMCRGGKNSEAGSKANALLPHHRPLLHFEFYQSVQTVR